MKHIKCIIALLLMLSINNMEAAAQFYTVNFVSQYSDTLSLSADPYKWALASAKLGTEFPVSKSLQGKSKKIAEKSFPKAKKAAAKLHYFPSFDATDSLILELIKKRLTICMPLDLIKVNSPYGYRKDPLKKCQKFHDGIDLHGINELVFSMLPGKVYRVGHGSTGYGNFVELDHGNIRCLYAHLSMTMVKEGDIVDAGTAVGRVGNTGKSTNNHLHIRTQFRKGAEFKSTDPKPLIDWLNNYMNELNKKIYMLSGMEINPQPTEEVIGDELTIANLYKTLKAEGVKHPKIVLAQAILETGHFKSRLTFTHNNIFGLRRSDGKYFAFSHWKESVRAYRDKVQYKHRNGEDYYKFLARIKYAASPTYINKVREIAEKL